MMGGSANVKLSNMKKIVRTPEINFDMAKLWLISRVRMVVATCVMIMTVQGIRESIASKNMRYSKLGK